MATITMVVIFGMGIATGIYISSQIERHVDRNIKK